MTLLTSSLRRATAKLGKKTLFLPFACMAGIFLLSSIPGGRHEVLGYGFELSPKLGNLLHLPVYGILAGLWMLAFETRAVPYRRAASLACLLATLFGALDEVHQSFVPLRCMDARDVIANFAGALVAVLAWPRLRGLFFEPAPQPRLPTGSIAGG